MLNFIRFNNKKHLIGFKLLLIILCNYSNQAHAAISDERVEALTAHYQTIQPTLNNTAFKRPLTIESTEASNALKSEVYAVINHPFSMVQEALMQPAHWCDALILHINIKYCHMNQTAQGARLQLNIGQKTPQSLPQTYKTLLNYQAVENTPAYFLINLNAKNGPLGTYDYDILLEAIPMNGTQTFLHFTYAYAFGAMGNIAMKSYLNTIGRDKVGFSTSVQADGESGFIKGVRGVIERNTMRYFLAIDAYLAALNEAPNQQLESRLNHWFDGTALYKAQLFEMEREAYLTMKRQEVQRQNTLQNSAN